MTGPRAQRPLAGVALILLTTLCFAALDASAKLLSTVVPVLVMLWARYTVQAVAMGAWFAGTQRLGLLRSVHPRFQRVRVELQAVIDRAADASAVVVALSEQIDAFLDPLTGGRLGRGWPIGEPIRHAVLVRRLLDVAGVRAISSLTVYLDGVRSRGCGDHRIAPLALLCPETHPVRGNVETAP